MKIIKTYEGFKEKKSIEEYNDVLDSFLDDLKDISIGFNKTNFSSCIMYCFFIKNYKSKKNEISLFLEEIKSACKSLNIKFENFINSSVVKINLKSGESIDYIEIFFYKTTNLNLYNAERLFTLEQGAYKLDLDLDLDFNLVDIDYDDQDYYEDYEDDYEE